MGALKEAVESAVRADPRSVYERLGAKFTRVSSAGGKAKCPLHNEVKGMSLSVGFAGEGAGLWRCFGKCGAGGDVFSFCARLKGLDEKRDFPRILEEVAATLGIVPGIEPPSRPLQKQAKPGPPPTSAEMENLAWELHDALMDNENAAFAEARRHLFEVRAVSPDFAREFAIGFNGEHFTFPIWDGDNNFVGVKGYRPSAWPKATRQDGRELPKCRKIIGDTGQRFYPQFLLDGDCDHLLILEGEPDGWTALSVGYRPNPEPFRFPAVTVTCGGGSSFPADVPDLSGKMFTIIPDNDETGRKFMATMAAGLLEHGAAAVNVLQWPEGTPPGFDFTDWLTSRRDGQEDVDAEELAKLVEELLATAQPWKPPASKDPHVVSASAGESDEAAGVSAPLPLIPEVCWRHPFRLIRDIYSGTTEAPDAYFFAAFSAWLSCMLSRLVRHRYGGWPIPPNHYVALVGPTGDRKSTAPHCAARICRDADPTLEFLPGVGSGEGLIDVLGRMEHGKPALPRVMLQFAEFANLLTKARQDGSTLVPILTEVYDGKAKVGLPTRKSPLVVEHPRLAILAMSTQEWIETKMQPDDARGGFANRFTYYVGPLKPPMPDPPPPAPGTEETLREEFRDLVRYWTDRPGEVVLAPGSQAAEIWREFYLALRARRETWDELTHALLQRTDQHVRKLAVLYAAVERQREITGEMMQAAVAMADYWIASTRHVFRRFDLTQEGRVELKIQDLLAAHAGPMKLWMLHQRISGRVTSERLYRILEGLERTGRIVLSSKDKTAALAGREDGGPSA